MVVAILLNAGNQVPVIPFCEMAGNVIAGAPLHIAAIGAKIGVVLTALTATVNVVGRAHWPTTGVKV